MDFLRKKLVEEIIWNNGRRWHVNNKRRFKAEFICLEIGTNMNTVTDFLFV
jgi:hypothetical protein